MYHYVKIESERNRYVCLEQNLVSLAWLLFFKKDILRPILRTESKKLSFWFLRNWLLGNLRFLRKNIFLLIRFVRYKYQMKKHDRVVKFQFFGQICVPVHQGYKIFDIRRGVVFKVFDSDVNASVILNEIEQLKEISQIEFAPSLRRWNIEDRWLEEDYISGSLDSSYTPLDSEAVLKRFCHDLVPLINCLILSQRPKLRNAVEYAEHFIENLTISRLSQQQSTVREYEKIKTFLVSTIERLRIEGNCPIFLVFTHGDFCPANMVNVKGGLKVIDWEGAGYRSSLFDVYSYYFYRPVARKLPVAALISEIDEALPFFISNLEKKVPEMAESLKKIERVYRWVYYVEQVCKEIEREGTDKNLNILDNILGYINVFNGYEEILDGKFELASKPQN